MTATRRAVGERVGWVDAVRGLAIVLMLLDHLLVQIAPHDLLRYTLTRASLPLFMLAAATVWRPSTTTGWRWSWRPVRFGFAVVSEGAMLPLLGMPQPGIVTVFALVSVWLWAPAFGTLVDRYPVTVGGVALVQALYLPVGWAGYEPGLVLAWWCLGRVGQVEVERWARRLPRWLEPIGRRPLTWYVGHLWVLSVLVAGGVL